MAETTVADYKNESSQRNANKPEAGIDFTEDYTDTVSEESLPLEKYISFSPIVALGLTLQSAWEAVAVTFQGAFLNGGPISLVYGILIVTVGTTSLAASLAEMAAVDPAIGAQYRWAARYAPKSFKPHFWGFLQGWLTALGWIAACAATPFLIGTVVQDLIEFNDPTYVPKRWHTTLLVWAWVLLGVVGNLFARRVLVALEIFGGLLHLSLFLAVVITLGVLVPRSSNHFVWATSVSGVSGWNDSGVTFCIGLLSPALAVIGFDGLIHMSGETKEAAKFVPRGMVTTVVTNGTVAFGFIVCLLYTLGDPSVTLDPASSSLPILMVLYNATGSIAAVNAIMSLILVVFSVGNFSIFASVSRLVFAFARDGGLPFSHFFSYIQPGLLVPVNALILVAVLCALLALINIGSTVAFYAIISLATVSLVISYMPPILFFLIRKLRGETVAYGSFRLGRFGIPINIFGLCYALFMTVWLVFPTEIPVTGATMNYASPVWGGCIIFVLVDYWFYGHKRFRLAA